VNLSEKSLEINFCAQFSNLLGNNIMWFSPSSVQEAKLAYDACAILRGRIYVFQFKMSKHKLKNDARRFHLNHNQMVTLRRRCNVPSTFYYVFPDIGSYQELFDKKNVVHHSKYLDINKLPQIIPDPFIKGTTTLRKNNIHYGDVHNSKITIHSEPFILELEDTSYIVQNDKSNNQIDKDSFIAMCRLFKVNSYGLVVP